MKTYLLTWNPLIWDWPNFDTDYELFKHQGYLNQRWNCGHNKSIVAGDRIFLLRQGKSKRGIVASGEIIKSVYEATNFNDASKTMRYVDVRFDSLIDKDDEPYPRANLESGAFQNLSYMNWNAQSSGITIPQDVAAILEQEWANFIDTKILANDFPDEISSEQTYFEGTKRTVVVNAYERNEVARKVCIKQRGLNCAVCDTNFEERYGDLGKDFIHIHHLKPLSLIKEGYQVDPIQDLIPVCPNCHAMLHRRNPPVSIEELKRIYLERLSSD